MGKQRKLIAKTSRGEKIYRVEEYADNFVVRRTTGGRLPLTFGEERIGSARSLADAIAVVKAHSGSDKVDVR